MIAMRRVYGNEREREAVSDSLEKSIRDNEMRREMR